MRVVTQAQVQRAFDLDGALDLIRQIYRMSASGAADVSMPAAMVLRGGKASTTRFKIKGAVIDDLNVAGFRLIGDADSIHGQDHAYCYLVDPLTAAPFALVEEEWLHGVRTALTGIVAVEALAAEGVSQLALIGTGRIARHFAAFAASVHPEWNIVLTSRSPARAAQAANDWSQAFGVQLSAAQSVPEAVRGARIVVTLSDARESLFAAEDIRPGTLVCAMGGRQEFERDVLDRSDRFIVDEVDFVCSAGNVASWIAAGNATRTEIESAVDATIGEVLQRSQCEPTAPDGVCLAVIQGMAACDIGLAKWIYDRTTGGC